MGMMEKKMETTIVYCLGFRVQVSWELPSFCGQAFLVLGCYLKLRGPVRKLS